MPKQKIMAAIFEKTKKFITQNFKSAGTGASYILEMFPELYSREIIDIKKLFTQEELIGIIYCFQSRPLHPDMAGRIIPHTAKTDTCSVFTLSCLEIWAQAFWLNGGKNKNPDEYINSIPSYGVENERGSI